MSYSERVTASLHKLTAGDGYTYLTRQVAVVDSTQRGRSTLSDYYSEKGERPGRWVGQGVAGLGSVQVGGQVSEAQMRALFGEGRHPDADQLQKDVITAGGSASTALKASQLGRTYPVMKGEPTQFLVETQRRYQRYNAEHGQRLNHPVPEEVRSAIRTEVGRITFEAEHGRPPVDDQELTSHVTRQSRRPAQAVAGFDATFTPVKSVSALWAVAPRPVAEQIEAAHEAAVDKALKWLEQEVAHTRRGAGGARQTEVTGIVATAFTHRDSRNGDPNLHTHVAVANKVQDRSDGAWLSLDGAALYRAMVTVSEHYNTHLEAELVDRLGVQFASYQPSIDRRPIRDLVGVPTQLLDAWSSRRAQIEAETAHLARAFSDQHGRAPTATEMIQLAQQANLATREAKHEPRSLASQRAAWRDQAVAILGSPEAVDDITRAVSRRPPGMVPEARIQLDAAGLEHLAEGVVLTVSRARARWQPTHVMAEAYRRIRDLGLPSADIDIAVERLTAKVLEQAVPLGREDEIEVPEALRRSDGTSVYEPKHTRLYTTTSVLEAEERIVHHSLQRDGRTVDETALMLALLEAEANGQALNTGQAALVTALGTSGQRVQLAIAPAGSGKTTAMQVLARAWTDSGGTVVGLAPSAVAADELRAAVPNGTVDTLAQLAYALRPTTDGTQIPLPVWAEDIHSGTLVVVDEAGMAGTTELADVIEYVVGHGGSVRLIGDDRQLAAVGAGGVLRDVREAAGSATLAELMRFSDPAEAAATLAVRDGDPAAVGFYLDQGRIHDTGDPTEEIVAAWAADVAAGRHALMITSTREAAATLNGAARERRIAAGFVDGAGSSVALRSGLPAAVGDEVMTRRNDRRNRLSVTDFVKNGDRWTVLEVGQTGGLRLQHERSGKQTWVRAEYVQEHVDHAYAVTVHSAQGSTVDVSHVLLDGSENRQLAYVALSRGRVGNHVYLSSSGDGDPHSVIRPEVVRPSTGAEMLEVILQRDGVEESASTSRRIAASPQQQLRQHALRYLDGVFAAAEDLAGPEKLREIEEQAETLQPGVTECGGWPQLKMMLATVYAAGTDPIAELRRVRDRRPLGDARDVAAVLAYRLDDAGIFGGSGPLPWLRAISEPLGADPTWGPYLRARAESVRHYAREVQDQAALTPEPPRWARSVAHHGTLVRELAVWRAAAGIADTDPLPAGSAVPPSAERNYQQQLEAKVEAVAGPPASLPPAAEDLLQARAPQVSGDPLWPVLARRLSAVRQQGVSVKDALEAALDEGQLPDERPAAALWFRLAGQLGLTWADVDPDIRLRPDWTDALLRRLPHRAAAQVLTSPDWPHLVAAVAASVATTGTSADDLLDRAIDSLNLNDEAVGGLPSDAVATMLRARLTDTGTVDVDELPPDPHDLDASRPDDLDALSPLAPVDRSATAAPELLQLDAEPDPVDEPPLAVDEVEVDSTARTRLIQLNNTAAEWWATQYQGSAAANYITGRLGNDLADDSSVTVGYAPAGWTSLVDHLRATGASDTELVDAGLAKWSRRGSLIDVMRDRVVFGIRDARGDLVGFTGRAAPGDTDAPKWLNTPSTRVFAKGEVLFGLAENRERLAAGATPVRVEGVLDALAVTMASNGQAVGLAPLGTALTAAQAEVLVRAGTSDVVLHATDTDSAGRAAAAKDYWLLTARGADVRRLVLTDGQQTFHDPAEAYHESERSLSAALGATSVAPALAGQLAGDVITRNRDLLGDRHAHAIVGVGREIGSILAATPPEQRDDLVRATADMLADATHDPDGVDHYREVITDATRTAAHAWNPTPSQPAAGQATPPRAAGVRDAHERLRRAAAAVLTSPQTAGHSDAEPGREAAPTSDALRSLSALRDRQQSPAVPDSDDLDQTREDRHTVTEREPDRGGLER